MKKCLITAVYFISPLIPGTILYFSDPDKYSDHGVLAGMIFGVCAFTWLMAELIIIARIKYVEKDFGQDLLFRVHGFMAVTAILLSVAHKVIEESIYGSLIVGFVGNITLYIFLFISLFALLFMANTFVSRFKKIVQLKIAAQGSAFFGYEFHRILHNLAVIGIIILYVHVMLTSSAAEHLSVKAVYSAMFSICFLFYIYHKIITRIILRRNRYVVTKVKGENSNIWTLELVPIDGKVLMYKPGQFAFLRFYGEGISYEEHPFSLSSDPSDRKKILVTIKELGNFTSSVKNIKAGYTASVDGPYGKFSYLNYPEETETVLIAGGVGITPAFSMLRYMRSNDKNRNVTLIWGLGSRKDLLSLKELESMKQEMRHLHIVPVMFKDDAWDGEKGIIDRLLISRLLKHKGHMISEVGFYICGPDPMLRLVRNSLTHIGISKKQIHFERF
jgi:predicted ferric reductase